MKIDFFWSKIDSVRWCLWKLKIWIACDPWLCDPGHITRVSLLRVHRAAVWTSPGNSLWSAALRFRPGLAVWPSVVNKISQGIPTLLEAWGAVLRDHCVCVQGTLLLHGCSQLNCFKILKCPWTRQWVNWGLFISGQTIEQLKWGNLIYDISG